MQRPGVGNMDRVGGIEGYWIEGNEQKVNQVRTTGPDHKGLVCCAEELEAPVSVYT